MRKSDKSVIMSNGRFREKILDSIKQPCPSSPSGYNLSGNKELSIYYIYCTNDTCMLNTRGACVYTYEI